jgi:hypothetical protein
VGISFIMIVLGMIIRRTKDLSLQIAEWVVTSVEMFSVLYACYVAWVSGVDPIWTTGTTLIFVGVLNYLTGTKQTPLTR